MISVLLTILILLAVNFGSGFILIKLLRNKDRSFTFVSLTGIIAVTVLQTVAAFFVPLNSYLEIFFVSVGLAGTCWFILREKRLPFEIKFNFWFPVFFLLVLFAGSFSPYLFDHYSYYAPTISYLKETGFVKGIANLDLLLGQTSFWHIYQAGFSHFTDSYLKINAYILVLFLFYIFEKKSYFLLIFFPAFLLFVQQPSPDLPVLIITLIVFNELVNKRENSVILYLSLFAFCIKPIVFWLPLFVILNNFNKGKFVAKSFIPVSIFGILLVMKNLWLCGLPVFPMSILDFNLPWKPSQEMMTYSSQIGMMKSYDMKYSYQQVTQFDFFDSIYHWFTIGYKSVLNIGIVMSFIIISVFVIRKKTRFYYFLLFCLVLKSIVIFSFSAQYRFFIDVYLIALFLILNDISESKAVFIAVFLSIFISVIFTFPGFVQQYNMGKWMSGFSWSQIYKPKTIKQVDVNKNFKLGNLSFSTSKDIRNKNHFPVLGLYDVKLYEYYGIFPQYFGNDFKNGIFQRKITAQEKIRLKEIIAETEKQNP